MPHLVLQASTDGFYIFADDADAYGEGLAGLNVTVLLSKAGGPFFAVAPAITDLGGGVYWIAPLAAHRDTLGEIAWRFEATGAVIAPRFERVVAVNDQLPAWGAGESVLTAAEESPINSNVTHFLGEPAELADDVAKQETLLEVQAAVGTMTAEAVRVPSPNVGGKLVLVSGDTYDGIGQPKASWTVATDYSDGWDVTLTIRDQNDEVVLQVAGEVASATQIVVPLTAPSGLEYEGCPGVWQGKFDVELSKGTSRKTIALDQCFIKEDQTR